MNNKFAVGEKWFWIGIAVSVLNFAAGLVYGIALVVEEEYRKEGAIIIAFAILWLIIAVFFIGPWLMKSGMLPQYRLMKIPAMQ